MSPFSVGSTPRLPKEVTNRQSSHDPVQLCESESVSASYAAKSCCWNSWNCDAICQLTRLAPTRLVTKMTQKPAFWTTHIQINSKSSDDGMQHWELIGFWTSSTVHFRTMDEVQKPFSSQSHTTSLQCEVHWTLMPILWKQEPRVLSVPSVNNKGLHNSMNVV
jgi:hypothetical protein